MRPLGKQIRELLGPTGPYSIRAKVIHKTSIYSPTHAQHLDHQNITFEDEEGTRMETTLYNEELEVFDNVIEDNMEYDISNAILKAVPQQLSANTAALLYKIEFNINTIIKPVPSLEAPASRRYISITSIPRTISLDNSYDVLGVVIYVDRCYQITDYNGQPLNACEVVIIDHSHAQVMTVTAWSGLAAKECVGLHSIAGSFPVVGLTALMPCYRKGFSLATTHSTFIVINPEGEKADSLRSWARENQTLLAGKKKQVFEVRLPEISRTVTTIERLLDKTPNNTLQEEHHWLHVKLNEFNSKDVHLYLGCSNCGTSTFEKLHVTYTCTTCLKENVVATPRMAITIEAIDDTGNYTLAAFTENAETILEVQAATLYSMPPQARESYLSHVEDKLRTAKLYIQPVPGKSLYRTQELKWKLKQVSLI